MKATLIERLKAATGPDRGIDIAIWEATEPHKYLYTQSGRVWAINRRGTALTPVWEPCADPRPLYTDDLNAVVALIKRSLPGWRWSVSSNEDGSAFAYVFRRDETREPGHQHIDERANAATPALALCLAAIKALEIAA